MTGTKREVIWHKDSRITGITTSTSSAGLIVWNLGFSDAKHPKNYTDAVLCNITITLFFHFLQPM